MNYTEGRNFELLIEEDSWRVVWIKDGVFHNEDGPAIEYAHGTKLWYLFGIQVSKEDIELFKSKKKLNKNLEEKLAIKEKEKRTKI